MKDKFRQFPKVLQKQILIRLTAGIVSLLMLVIILLYRGGLELMFPCIGFSAVFFISALQLYSRCDEKNYVVIKGTCTEIEKTGLRRKVKDIYVKGYTSKPSGWDENWNSGCSATVHWNYAEDEQSNTEAEKAALATFATHYGKQIYPVLNN